MIKRIKDSFRYHWGIQKTHSFNAIRENMLWYEWMYKISKIYCDITSRSYLFKKTPIAWDQIKRVAIIYSKKHFNPKEDKENQYSASNIARQIYEVFKDKEVFYFDQGEIIEKIPQVDLVVGIISENFKKVAKINPKATRILFLVNSHPIFRLKVLIRESELLKKTFSIAEYVSPFKFLNLLKYTDRFVVIGNKFVKKTFEDYGIKSEFLNLINTSGNTLITPDPSKRPTDKIRVIYVGSHLAIRKGLFRVMQVWDALKDDTNNFELVIIGGLNEYKDELLQFMSRHSNVKYLGWVESNTHEYINYIQSSHILLNLSIEEGQVGCVLDGMSAGVVPIITEQSGVEIHDGVDGFIVEHNDIDGIVKKINSLKLSDLREGMSRNTLYLIKDKYTWQNFRKDFKVAIEN